MKGRQVVKISIFKDIMYQDKQVADFEHVLITELQQRGHELSYVLPTDYQLNRETELQITYLKGKVIDFTKLSFLQRLTAGMRLNANRQRWYAQLYRLAEEKAVDAFVIPWSNYEYLKAAYKNILLRANIPIVFLQYGIQSKDISKLHAAAKLVAKYPMLRVLFLAPDKHVLDKYKLPNVFPVDIPEKASADEKKSPATLARRLEKLISLELG